MVKDRGAISGFRVSTAVIRQLDLPCPMIGNILTDMKQLILLLTLVLSACCHKGPAADAIHPLTGTPTDREALQRTTAAIRDAFARGDVDAIVALHHPGVIKYFGGNKVVTGREDLRKQLTGWLGATRVEFVENTIESTVFNGETAIETSIFSIRSVPKNGDKPSQGRGRAMVVYIKYPGSPTGWASLREMAQEAPPK
jgi:ketosteroid isomerase-like protein